MAIDFHHQMQKKRHRELFQADTDFNIIKKTLKLHQIKYEKYCGWQDEKDHQYLWNKESKEILMDIL